MFHGPRSRDSLLPTTAGSSARGPPRAGGRRGQSNKLGSSRAFILSCVWVLGSLLLLLGGIGLCVFRRERSYINCSKDGSCELAKFSGPSQVLSMRVPRRFLVKSDIVRVSKGKIVDTSGMKRSSQRKLGWSYTVTYRTSEPPQPPVAPDAPLDKQQPPQRGARRPPRPTEDWPKRIDDETRNVDQGNGGARGADPVGLKMEGVPRQPGNGGAQAKGDLAATAAAAADAEMLKRERQVQEQREQLEKRHRQRQQQQRPPPPPQKGAEQQEQQQQQAAANDAGEQQGLNQGKQLPADPGLEASAERDNAGDVAADAAAAIARAPPKEPGGSVVDNAAAVPPPEGEPVAHEAPPPPQAGDVQADVPEGGKGAADDAAAAKSALDKIAALEAKLERLERQAAQRGFPEAAENATVGANDPANGEQQQQQEQHGRRLQLGGETGGAESVLLMASHDLGRRRAKEGREKLDAYINTRSGDESILLEETQHMTVQGAWLLVFGTLSLILSCVLGDFGAAKPADKRT